MKKLVLFLTLLLLVALPFASATYPCFGNKCNKGEVTPVFECWEKDGRNTYILHFGYESTYQDPVMKINFFRKGLSFEGYYAGPFLPGVQEDVITKTWKPRRHEYYSWTLDGNIAYASLHKNKECQQPVEEVPEFGVLAGLAVLAGAGVFIYRKRAQAC